MCITESLWVHLKLTQYVNNCTPIKWVLQWVFVAVPGLSLAVGYSVAVCGLLTVVVSLVEHGL